MNWQLRSKQIKPKAPHCRMTLSRRNLSYLALIWILLSGCGGAPKWITNPPQPPPLMAVGVAQETFDPSVMRQQAGHNARLEISRIIDLRVQEVVKDWARSRQDGVTGQHSLDTYFESVSHSILDMPLPNVIITEYYFDPKERRMYALAHLNLNLKLAEIKEIAKKQTQQHLSFPSQSSIDNAFQELDFALDQIGGKR